MPSGILIVRARVRVSRVNVLIDCAGLDVDVHVGVEAGACVVGETHKCVDG